MGANVRCMVCGGQVLKVLRFYQARSSSAEI